MGSANRVLKIEIDHIPVGTLFVSVGGLNALAVVDPHSSRVSVPQQPEQEAWETEIAD